MSQKTTTVRSAVAAAANADTVVFTPANGVRHKLMFFYITNEAAAQAAGMSFELRYGATILAVGGLDSAAAPIGQTSKAMTVAHEIIGDGATAVQVRNLVALNAASQCAYTVGYSSDAPDAIHRGSGDSY